MMASFDMLRSQQDAARALFELAGHSTTFPAAPAPLPGMGAPLFLLPSLHQSQSGGAFFPNLFVPGGLCLPTLPAFTSTPSSGAPSPSSAAAPSTGNNQRLSVAYLLNNDDSLTTGRPATIKQEPVTAAPVFHKRKTSSSTSTSSSATRGSKRPKVEPSFSSSPASSSPPSSPPSHSSSLSATSSSIASSSTSTPFKGDLSLFPHLQLQLQREQLDPQQHTELVLKVWNRQQQVLKLQQLQQKKQELKAQRLRQRQSRKGSKGAVASPLSPGSSSSSPSSPASADVAAQSALPTIDDILNGADMQVDESSGGSDEDSNGNKKGGKRPRRRITARQVAVLEQVFAVEPFPGPSTKKVIAKKLGMQERSITIWFQNKRARLKRIDGDSATGHHHGQVGENGKREVTFHNLAVGFDGKLDMLPEDF